MQLCATLRNNLIFCREREGVYEEPPVQKCRLTIAEKADYYGKQNEKSAYKRLFCTAYLACTIKRRMRACSSFFANVCANGLAKA